MKPFIDLFPAILFFITFKLMGHNPERAADWASRLFGETSPEQAPILIATLVVIVATFLQVVWTLWRHGKVGKMLWISLALVVTFGSLTLIFHNDTFIKWKFTIFYWAMAASMAVAALFRKNPIRLMMPGELALPEPVWFRLNLSWIIFFVFMGALNLYVAFTFSMDVWMNFKMFGTMGLIFIFGIAQGLYLSRFMENPESGKETPTPGEKATSPEG